MGILRILEIYTGVNKNGSMHSTVGDSGIFRVPEEGVARLEGRGIGVPFETSLTGFLRDTANSMTNPHINALIHKK